MRAWKLKPSNIACPCLDKVTDELYLATHRYLMSDWTWTEWDRRLYFENLSSDLLHLFFTSSSVAGTKINPWSSSSRFVSALSWWNLAVALLARLLAEAKLALIVGGQSDKTPLIKSTTVNSRSRCCMTHWFIINDIFNQMWLFICLYWILMDFSIILVWKLVETETDALTINKTKLVKWIKSPIKKVLSVRLV